MLGRQTLPIQCMRNPARGRTARNQSTLQELENPPPRARQIGHVQDGPGQAIREENGQVLSFVC